MRNFGRKYDRRGFPRKRRRHARDLKRVLPSRAHCLSCTQYFSRACQAKHVNKRKDVFAFIKLLGQDSPPARYPTIPFKVSFFTLSRVQPKKDNPGKELAQD